VLLTLFSTYTGLGDIAFNFFISLYHRDIPGLKSAARDFVLLVGRAVALRFAVGILERAVSPFLFYIYVS
jgi:hypothetical protein